ncbi:MAG: SIMPL domain-containing protein [Nakamurella sp.]
MSVEITVQGTFTTYQPPQRATVRLRVGLEGPKKDAVFAGVSTAANTVSSGLVALLNPSAGPVTWWSSDQLRSWADRPWNSDGKQLPLVFHAAVGFQAKFSNFEALSEWLARVVDADGVSVEGIDWALTESSKKELTVQVRSAAVLAAKTKAAAYAEALGLGEPQALAIADAGMLGEGLHPTSQHYTASSRSMHAESGTALQLAFEPQDVEVSATVDARFTAG